MLNPPAPDQKLLGGAAGTAMKRCEVYDRGTMVGAGVAASISMVDQALLDDSTSSWSNVFGLSSIVSGLAAFFAANTLSANTQFRNAEMQRSQLKLESEVNRLEAKQERLQMRVEAQQDRLQMKQVQGQLTHLVRLTGQQSGSGESS
jgi:uncharacterized protein YlxW (UPF0749 family)